MEKYIHKHLIPDLMHCRSENNYERRFVSRTTEVYCYDAAIRRKTRNPMKCDKVSKRTRERERECERKKVHCYENDMNEFLIAYYEFYAYSLYLLCRSIVVYSCHFLPLDPFSLSLTVSCYCCCCCCRFFLA